MAMVTACFSAWKLENIKSNKIKVSEMGKYFDVLRIICHTEKKEKRRYD